MKLTTAPNRKTGRLIVKNLIILLVLAVVVFLAAWAWFTQSTTAEANGINVKAKASGVKVSWDDKDYYDNLTAKSESGVEEGVTGLAKDFGNGAPYTLDLITGDGLSFFKPSLNLRTGEVVTDESGAWQGSAEAAEGHYVDVDLYFSGDSAREIYLAGDSRVSPKSTAERMSEYGNFSKDYIASAARVAFLNEDKSACSYIWAPNSDYELKQSDAGYKKHTTVKTEQITTGGGTGTGNIPEGMTTDMTSYINDEYYLWIPNDYKNDQHSQMSGMVTGNKMDILYTDDQKKTGLFVYEYIIDCNNFVSFNNDVTIPFAVNKNGATLTKNEVTDYIVTDSTARTQFNSYDETAPPKVLMSGEFNINFDESGSSVSAPSFYINTGFVNCKMYITIGYNPSDKTVMILKYRDEEGEVKDYDITGGTTTTTTVSFYELDDNTPVVLANSDNSAAVRSNGESVSAQGVTFALDGSILPYSVSSDMIFTAEKTGTGYSAVYKFKDGSGRYLALSGGSATLTDTGTQFSLKYIEGFSGPALFDETSCLVFSSGGLSAVGESALEANKIFTIYTGSSYEMLTSSQSAQEYKFYDAVGKELKDLNSASTPPLYASTSKETEAAIIAPGKPIATLQQDSSDPTAYKAHIVIRVWVEGTDRDALLPLKGGQFNMSLHFTAKTANNS